MSSYYPDTAVRETSIRNLPLDDRRGIYAMWCIIATEGSLFACLFASYFYLGSNHQPFGFDQPPKMTFAWIMLAVLLVSAVVLRWGENQANRERFGAGRIAILLTIVLGLGYLTLEYFDFHQHLRTLTPQSDSYGSIFYAITGFHVVHVVVGILMLVFTLFLPKYGPTAEPYRPYQTVALYWYFVNALWISVFLIMYLIPNLTAHG